MATSSDKLMPGGRNPQAGKIAQALVTAAPPPVRFSHAGQTSARDGDMSQMGHEQTPLSQPAESPVLPQHRTYRCVAVNRRFGP